MSIHRDQVDSIYDLIISEFPQPKDALLALEYITAMALVSGAGKLNKEKLDSLCYRFSRNLTKRAKDISDLKPTSTIAGLKVIK